MADWREMTRSAGSRASSVISASVIPSAKNSSSGLPVRFSSGSTASAGTRAPSRNAGVAVGSQRRRELLRLGRRLDPELRLQLAAELPVSSERPGTVAAAVQRQQQAARQRLVVGPERERPPEPTDGLRPLAPLHEPVPELDRGMSGASRKLRAALLQPPLELSLPGKVKAREELAAVQRHRFVETSLRDRALELPHVAGDRRAKSELLAPTAHQRPLPQVPPKPEDHLVQRVAPLSLGDVPPQQTQEKVPLDKRLAHGRQPGDERHRFRLREEDRLRRGAGPFEGRSSQETNAELFGDGSGHPCIPAGDRGRARSRR